MALRMLKLRCYHADCAADPPLVIRVEVPHPRLAPHATKEQLVQCERGHYNVITLPDTWNAHEPVLGGGGGADDDDDMPLVHGTAR